MEAELLMSHRYVLRDVMGRVQWNTAFYNRRSTNQLDEEGVQDRVLHSKGRRAGLVRRDGDS